MKEAVSESRFYMWRTVFAMAHADHKVCEEELDYMRQVLDTVSFSIEQRRILENDMAIPQPVSEMFLHINDQADRAKFFYYARLITWCDGDFHEQEQQILTLLGNEFYNSVDFDSLVGLVDLELEESEKAELVEDVQAVQEDNKDSNDEHTGLMARFLKKMGVGD